MDGDAQGDNLYDETREMPTVYEHRIVESRAAETAGCLLVLVFIVAVLGTAVGAGGFFIPFGLGVSGLILVLWVVGLVIGFAAGVAERRTLLATDAGEVDRPNTVVPDDESIPVGTATALALRHKWQFRPRSRLAGWIVVPLVAGLMFVGVATESDEFLKNLELLVLVDALLIITAVLARSLYVLFDGPYIVGGRVVHRFDGGPPSGGGPNEWLSDTIALVTGRWAPALAIQPMDKFLVASDGRCVRLASDDQTSHVVRCSRRVYEATDGANEVTLFVSRFDRAVASISTSTEKPNRGN